MKVLVTGGGGFLGKHMVRKLLDRDIDVRVLGRSRYPALEAWKVDCVQGDVCDPEAVKRAVDGVQAVFHVAARVGYWGPYAEYERTNVGGTQNLLDASVTAGVERFVYTSTPSVVIGPEGEWKGADESTPYPDKYLSSYGPTKAEAERRVLGANGAALRTASLRPHLIYGPGDPQIAPRLVKRAHQGAIAQVGDGSNQIDVAYIDNVVTAHLQVLDALAASDSPVAGQAYFLGDAAPVRLWDFVARMLAGFSAPPIKKQISFRTAWTVGRMLELVYGGLRLSAEPPMTRMAAVFFSRSHYFSHAKAARDFGYAPKISTDEGLERLFAAGLTEPA